MASRVIPVFVFSVVCVSLQNTVTAMVKLQFHNRLVGQLGQPFLLECLVQTSEKNTEIKGVAWTKDNDSIFFWKAGKIGIQESGYELAEPHFDKRNMNVSLLITRATIRNNGEYKCSVSTTKGGADSIATFMVTAKYSSPTIRPISEKGDEKHTTLVCESHGGYPEGKLQWRAYGQNEWIEKVETVPNEDQRGLYNLSSTLIVSSGSDYTCVVINATGGEEGEITFSEKTASASGRDGGRIDTHTKIVAPIVVIGSLTIGLLILVVLLLRRQAKRKARRQSSAPIMGNDRNTEENSPDEKENLTDVDNTKIDIEIQN